MKKFIVKQEEQIDCGAAALLSILKYYDGYVPLEIIKYDTLTNKEGANFYNIKETAIKYGFNASGIKTNDLSKVKLPCIVQVTVNHFHHFVCIYEYGRTVTLMDPSKGIVKMPIDEFNSLFNGFVLELIPNGQIIKYSHNNKLKKLLKDTFKVNFQYIITLILLALPLIGFTLLSNFNVILVFKYNLIWLVVLIISMNIFFTYAKNAVQSSLNHRVSMSIVKGYLNHLLNLPLKYLQLKKVGDLTNRINDLYNIKEVFSKILIDSLITLAFFVGSLGILFYLNYDLAMLILCITVLYLLVSFYLNKAIYYQIIKIMESDNVFIDKAIEYITKIKTIRNLSINYFQNKLNANIEEALDNKYVLDKKMNIINICQNILDESLFLIIISYNLYIKTDYLELIVYITVYHYYQNSMKYFANLIPSIMYYKNALMRINSLFAIDKAKIRKDNPLTNQDIVIEKLNYSYNGLNELFNGLSMKIKKGNKVRIIGSNGSGKSTLLDIIASNIETNNIKIDGQISYISQTSTLFSGTLLENILIEKPFDEKRFKLVEEITNLKEIIQNKPSGYLTHIYNSNISGGEKQRIILARNLYRSFDILILDEALSQIAKETRNQILKNIWQEFKEKTIIYVSHNNEVINYDQEIFLTARKDSYVNE